MAVPESETKSKGRKISPKSQPVLKHYKVHEVKTREQCEDRGRCNASSLGTKGMRPVSEGETVEKCNK